MYSLVVLCCENYGISDHEHCAVSGFESREDAYRYGLQRLIDAKQIVTMGNGKYRVVGSEDEFDFAEDVVENWAEYLGPSEYFHVVEELAAPVETA